jgi:hypothetical protein
MRRPKASTAVYTALAPNRFKDFWRGRVPRGSVALKTGSGHLSDGRCAWRHQLHGVRRGSTGASPDRKPLGQINGLRSLIQFDACSPRLNGSRTSSRRRNSQARLRRRAQSRSRERRRGRHVSIYKPPTVIRCLPRLARCHWGAVHPRKRRADFGVKSPSRTPCGTKCLKRLRSTRWNALLTGIGATRQRRPPLIDWVTGHGFDSTDETSALQNLNVVTVD